MVTVLFICSIRCWKCIVFEVIDSLSQLSATFMDASSTSKESTNNENDDWVVGVGRNRVLKFSCNAVSNSSSTLPAEKLHMTFKTIQAETKLLNALLFAHGLHEVRMKFIYSNGSESM